MQEYAWSTDRPDVTDFINQWSGGDASSLVTWAIMAAHGLEYLAQIDANVRSGRPPARTEHWQSVVLSHARWAATSAVTVLDLAAGALGRLHLPAKEGDREYSLRDFSDKGEQAKSRLEKLTPAGREWVVTTWADADYQTLRRARNPFTHGTLRMDATVTLGSPTPAQFFFHVGPNRQPVESGELVSMAFTLVDRRLGAFMSELQAGLLGPT